jgi:predicted nucleic acid-binding Zn ribbon protein
MTDPSVAGTFDLLAASIRADSADLRTYLDVVGAKLADALPGSVTVEREGGLFAKDHRVRKVTLRLEGRVFRLEWTGNDLRATIDAAAVPLDRWSESLAQLLSDHARTESQARSAMDSLVAGRLPARTLTRPPGDTIVARHPDTRFSLQSEVEVGQGDAAVILAGTDPVGPLGPGRHALAGAVTTTEDPAIGQVEGALFFVSTRERPNQRFGGSVDKVLDPQTGLAVGLRVFGEYVMQVADPVTLLRSLGAAQSELTDERITDVLRDVVLKVLRVDLAAHVANQGWPVLGLAAHSDELEQEALRRIQVQAAAFGLGVTRFGNFTISMKEEDEALLTQHHARMAGGAVAAPAGLTCHSCGAANAPGARFCSSCGKGIALHCPACGAENATADRFCSQCGGPLAAPGGAS